MHAKQRICTATPGTPLSGDGSLGGRLHTGGSCGQTGRDSGRGFPMEKGLRPGRSRWSDGKDPSRTDAQTVSQGERTAVEVAFPGTAKAWLDNRTLDTATGRRADRTEVWSPLRSVRSLAFAAPTRLDLSKARTTGAGTQPGCRRPMAESRLAASKKNRVVADERSSFSTNPASCCNRLFDVRGPHEAKRRCLIAGTDMIACRLSRRSPCRQNGVDWGSTSTSSITTSSLMISSSSSLTCFDASDDASSWCWIVGRFISLASDSFKNDLASASWLNGCPPTRQNSTPWNKSGTIPNTPTWRTSSPTTLCSWDDLLRIRSVRPDPGRPLFGRFSTTPASDGDNITWLFKRQ